LPSLAGRQGPTGAPRPGAKPTTGDTYVKA